MEKILKYDEFMNEDRTVSFSEKDLWSEQPIKEGQNTLQHFLKWLTGKDVFSDKFKDWDKLSKVLIPQRHNDFTADELKELITVCNTNYSRPRFYTFKNENGEEKYKIAFSIFGNERPNQLINFVVYTNKPYKTFN